MDVDLDVGAGEGVGESEGEGASRVIMRLMIRVRMRAGARARAWVWVMYWGEGCDGRFPNGLWLLHQPLASNERHLGLAYLREPIGRERRLDSPPEEQTTMRPRSPMISHAPPRSRFDEGERGGGELRASICSIP